MVSFSLAHYFVVVGMISSIDAKLNCLGGLHLDWKQPVISKTSMG